MSNSDMRFIGHRHSRIVRIRPQGHTHVLQQSASGVSVECGNGSGERGRGELPRDERLNRGKPHYQDLNGDARIPEPCLEEKGAQCLCIAHAAYRPHTRRDLSIHATLECVSQGRHVWILPKGTPDAEPEPSSRHEDPVHFAEGSEAIRKELQPLLTEHNVERCVGKREGHRTTFPPFHRHVCRWRERAGHREHAWVEVQARDGSSGIDAMCRETCHDACPTSHIHHALARAKSHPVDKILGPWGKEGRDQVVLVGFWRTPAHLPLVFWTHPFSLRVTLSSGKPNAGAHLLADAGGSQVQRFVSWCDGLVTLPVPAATPAAFAPHPPRASDP